MLFGVILLGAAGIMMKNLNLTFASLKQLKNYEDNFLQAKKLKTHAFVFVSLEKLKKIMCAHLYTRTNTQSMHRTPHRAKEKKTHTRIYFYVNEKISFTN